MRRNSSISLACLLFALLGILPVFAYDFHSWRSDGNYQRLSSTGQQSSNQAFNIFDQLADAASGSYSLYWQGELEPNGGQYAGGNNMAFGLTGPANNLTSSIRDNRQQDRDQAWATWPPVTGKNLAVPPAQPMLPVYTPNVPQAWSPVVYDLDDGFGTPDHFLVAPSFEPDQVGGTNTKEQILNVYYPQTGDGLPGNATSASVNDRGTSTPFWIRGTNNNPGIRIRDLAPFRASLAAANPGVGVVVQPPIFARVQAVYKDAGGNIINETLPVVYLVVGAGEANDYAKVVCISLKKPAGMVAGVKDWSPDPKAANGALLPALDISTANIGTDITDYFNPNNATGGAVMWSYTVKLRTDIPIPGNPPTPVAGISFADIGTSGAPAPRLFISTADGQIICLNAQAADQATFAQDGDAQISAPGATQADAPQEEWVYNTPITQPTLPAGAPVVTGLPDHPIFSYGMAPAVCRVPLTNLFSGNGNSANTVAKALANGQTSPSAADGWSVSEFEVFTADTYGVFRAFEAPGVKNFNAMMQLTGRGPLQRWQNLPYTGVPTTFRLDPLGNPERFIVPPVVYQGSTPLKNDSGAIINGSSDTGFDDEVIYSSEKGDVYVYDAIGRLQVGGANDGMPIQTTDLRYKFPTDDTALTPAQNGTASDEPRAWPREVPDDSVTLASPATWNVNDTNANSRYLGPPIANDAKYFSRAALSVSLGANANPNGLNPNLEAGDDNVYVPYLQEYTGPTVRGGRNYAVPAGSRAFYEYIGSLKPYGFTQMSRPILQLRQVRVTLGGTTFTVPLNRFRVGIVKNNGLPCNRVATIIGSTSQNGANPNFEQGAPAPEDTVYFVSPTWYDDTAGYQTIPFGTPVEFTYDAPTSPTNSAAQSVTETLTYPSCFRQFLQDPNDPSVSTVVRGRASLTEANTRLEQYRFQRLSALTPPQTDVNDQESPALVSDTLFTTYDFRQPSMYAAGSASTTGTLLAPSWFRGRVIALSHVLKPLRVILGSYDVRLDPNIRMQFSVGTPTYPYGPTPESPNRDFTYDPGVFFVNDAAAPAGIAGLPFLDDEPLISDLGASVTLVDGWAYVAHRNGHVAAYGNQGGAAGTINGNPPYIQLDTVQPATGGNLIHAPAPDTSATFTTTTKPRGIHFTSTPNDPTDYNNFLDRAAGATTDSPLLIEWGDTINVVVDFGAASELATSNSVDGNKPWTEGGGNDDVDGQILQNDVSAQIRSPNGAVQQLAGQARGVRPQVYTGAGGSRICAVIQVFTGVPSLTNPLTPGTPLLWEKDSTATPTAWNGEVTYEIQVSQQGLRWRWPPYVQTNPGMNPPQYTVDTTKEHYWEPERSSGQTRYPTTSGMNAGTPRWDWNNEWSPLLSYNNPIMVGYDPDGVLGNGIEGLVAANIPAGADTVGAVDKYTGRNDPGRRNGDLYLNATVDGSRSGSGQPVVPTVGEALVGGVAKQLLFADHGKSSPSSTTAYPELGKLHVGDRSKLAIAGRALMLRIQAAPLTKMGVGALYGRNGNGNLANLGAPAGSFEQNQNTWDDSPNGMYGSISPNRLAVTKQGTNLDLTQTPLQISGRTSTGINGGLPTFNKGGNPNNGMEQLAVQVDVPLYTADDVYSTRWRSATANGADPNPVGATATGSQFNPFFPSTILGQNARPLYDRAERQSRPAGQGPAPAAGEDPGPVAASFDPNPNTDDRLRRVVIFNDANGNGQLDLTPTYREAYRTFAVQVAVKPEMKIEAQQQLIDFGNIWHGKKQPGLQATNPTAIQEWQEMQLLSAGNALQKSEAQFYSQYWRAINLVNTGNVNLAYVKPEVAYQILGSGPQLIAIPSEGNDPWKALRLINGMGTALSDAYQIFLRTSFDDQLLPDGAAYGSTSRGVWLQKAQPGAAQGGAVAYVDPNVAAATVADPRRRDPSVGGAPRETYLAFNVPTGTPLGQYTGSIRFYNDRTVSFVENINAPAGFNYIIPPPLTAANQLSGTLDRDSTPASFGEPLEPVTDPPFRLKIKVVENTIHGRYQAAGGVEDQDRRFMPAASPDASAVSNGNVQRLLLAYISNRLGVVSGRQNVYDLFATSLPIDSNTGLFPYDELPRERIPWRDLANSVFGWTGVTASGNATQQMKPSLVQDPAGQAVLAWTERQSVGQGNDQYRIFYQPFTAAAPIQIQPGGQTPDPKIPRQGVRLAPVTSGGTDFWLGFYSFGQGLNRNLSYTFTTAANLANGASWAPERPLATPKGLASVTDPHVFTTPALPRVTPIAAQPNQPPYLLTENTTLPEMAWMSFTGSHLEFARTDIYLSRYRVPSLVQAGTRANPDLVDRLQDFARVGFPRTEGDVLRGNPDRTRYVSSGADFLVQPYSRVKLFVGRPDLPPANAGSTLNPFDLIGNQVGTETTNGEIVFPIDPAVVSTAPAGNQPALQQVRIYVDKGAGIFRLSRDSRTIVGLLTSALGSTAPDPVLTADFTAATVRVTKGDVPANDSVVIPTLSVPGGVQIMDASWYREQIDPGKWAAGTPVAGIADRLWVVWRRSASANSGGATAYFKVLRPGIRVKSGAIYGILPNELQVALNGNPVTPEEVNAQTGQVFFPQTFEGQRVDIRYLGPTGALITESHFVSWQDETGERPVPMDNSVNEGSIDGFASYEDVGMTAFGSNTTNPVRHLEKLWLFWSSTRMSGGDLMYATVAPRIGPDANVGNTAVFFAASPAKFTGMSPNAARTAMAQAAATERRKPFVVPPMYRRGPYVPRATGAAARRNR